MSHPFQTGEQYSINRILEFIVTSVEKNTVFNENNFNFRINHFFDTIENKKLKFLFKLSKIIVQFINIVNLIEISRYGGLQSRMM